MDPLTHRMMMAAASPAVPSLAGTATFASAPSANTVACDTPTHSEGDLLVAFMVTNNYSTGYSFVFPGGWTVVYAAGTEGFAWKYASASEPASENFGHTDVLRLGVVRAALRRAAFDALVYADSNVMPTVTASDKALLLLAQGNAAFTGPSFTAPAGMTDEGNYTAAGFCEVGLFSEVVPAGATGTRTGNASLERSIAATFIRA